jgi:hypothetical protein
MKLTYLILPLSLIAAANGFAQDVRYNYDKGAEFAKYKTYRWVEMKDAAKLDQLAEQQLKSAIEEELATKGLTATQGENADLYIGYQVSIDQEKQFTSYSSDFGYGPGWGRGWYGGGGGSSITTGQTSTIHIGSIALDMYDPARKQLIWRGEASKTLDPKAKPEKRAKNLKKAVAKLFKNYPPKIKT